MAQFIGPANAEGKRSCLITGHVAKEPVADYTPTKHVPRVKFSVCTGKKTYQNCLALGSGPVTDMAAALEARDVVLCAGTWSCRDYTKQDGTTAKWTEILLDAIFPMPTIGGGGAGAEAEGADDGQTAKPAGAPVDVFYEEDEEGALPF